MSGAGLSADAVESVLESLAAKGRTLTAQGKPERALGIDDARRTLHKAWSRQREARQPRKRTR